MFRGAALEKYPRRAAIVILGSSAGGSDHASTTFTVNSASDFADVNIGDGVCDAANLRNIIGEPVIIDGFTQPGASSNALTKGTNAKLMIELNGSGVTGTFESTGLRISAPNSTVQGLTINRFTSGVSVFAERVSVSQNLIGTDPSGTLDRGNSDSGIFVQGFGNVIGGASSQDANLISGNDGAGISIRSQASQTAVSHNLIGSDKSGTRGLGNSEAGVEITDSSHNFAENNTIAFNEGDGGRIEGGGGRTGVVVCANPILSNAIFSSPSGTDEGKTLLGQKTVKTDGTGNASFIFSAPAVPVGQNVTATATREFTLDTSEFSNPRTIKDAAAPRSRG